MLDKGPQAEQSFFREEERILSDIAGGSGFTFKRGEGWAINSETGDATYDPKFFEEKGYTPSQAQFAAFHEIKCHLVETADLLRISGGQEAHQRLKDRIKEKPRLHIWENCRTDIKGNQAIMGFAPSLAEDVETVYREKLWPETDLTDKPRHLQFMYAVLRNSMVPDEEVRVDPMVSAAIDKLRDVKGKDVIALATDPILDPLLALRLSERYIEPVIEELYQEDLKDRKGEQQLQGEGQGQRGSGEPFEGNYQDYENRHPEPMDEDEVEEKIKETIASQGASSRQAAGYEAEHGVSKKDIEEYQKVYREIEVHIELLRQVFRRIIDQRKIPVRHLVALKEEGVMIDPGLVAQTFMDIRAGITNPKTMKDFEGHFMEENIPGKFSLRLVADQSFSMGDGRKDVAQRKSAVVVMESLKEFSDILDEERGGMAVDLEVQTELRSFGVQEGTRLYKSLSSELTEKQRVEYFKGLMETKGGTNDYDALAKIEEDIKSRISADPIYAEELRSGKRREIVIVLSDGDSGNVPEAKRRAQNLRDLGVKVVGLGMTSGAVGIQTTYAPDGKVCYDESNLPKALEEMLSEYLGTLSIDGNPESVLQKKEEV